MSSVLVVPFELAPHPGLMESLERQLPRRLGLTVERGRVIEALASCYSARRRQYDALAVLAALEAASGGGRILGVTGGDLFLSVFTHVLGAAQLGGVAAVVSVHRLQPEAVGLPPDPALVEERLVKEAVHELGHTYGLHHCQNPACAMFAANNPDEVDLRGAEYHGNCLQKFDRLRVSL